MLTILQTATFSVTSAQDASGTFREAVSVNAETQVVKTLETAREHIIEGQWDTAVSILQELIDSSGDTLVPVEPGRYSNTGDYCHLLISQFPQVGLEAYRNRVDDQAKVWFESGQRTLDETQLLRIVDSAFNSAVGGDALWLLGELAFEQGRFALARQYWSLLIPSVVDQREEANPESIDNGSTASPKLSYLTYPDPLTSREEVLARLVLCSIFEGDSVRANSELAVCRAEFPDATGTLAGRTGKFVEILADVLLDSRRWDDEKRFTHAKTAPGGRLSRSGLSGPTPKTQEMIWRQSIPPNRFHGPAARSALETEAPPAFLPLVDKDFVFVCTADSVFAFDLSTGRPKWAIDDNDDGSIFTNVLERPITPHLPSAGMAWYSLCLSEGRLYARMGPPVMRRSRNEGNSFSEIIGLDVAEREGELVFHVTSDVLDPDAESPEATSWSFEGTPLVSDGRVYVSARRGFPEDETVVACFDANSSRLLWRRKVCASLKTAGDRFNLIGQNLLTLGDGRLFLSTDTGAVAALDVSTGRIQWVVTYQPKRNDTPQELSDPRRHGLTPCVYHRGIVYAAPNDTNLVYALDASTGQPIWTQQYPDQILHIVGVVNERLILSGQSIWAVDTRTGAPAWPQRIGFADPAGRGYGRPALSHDFLYWPTRDEILRIDHRQGNVVGRIRLREDFRQSGGNLVIAGGILLIAQPDGLVALGEVQAPHEYRAKPNIDPKLPRKSLPGSAHRTFKRGEKPFIRNVSLQLTAADELSPAVASAGLAALPDTGSFKKPTGHSVEHQNLWPARRTWEATLREGSAVRFPDQVPQSQSVGAVVNYAGMLQLLDPRDVKERWSASTSEPSNQIVRSGDTLAFVGSTSVIARNVNDGRLLWRHFLPASNSDRVGIRTDGENGKFLVITDSEVVTLESKSGNVVWRWPPNAQAASKPAATRFPAEWTFGRKLILFRPAGSADHALIDPSDGRLIRRGLLPFAATALLELPAYGNGSRTAIVGVDSDNHIRMTQLAELGAQWKHKASITTLGAPELLTDGASLLFVENRQFATRIDVETGKPLWRRPISATPLANVSTMAVLNSSELFTVSDHVVRAFSLEDGSKLWEQYTGPGPWKLRLLDGTLICIQSSPREEKLIDEPENAAIVILDSAHGRIVQRLRFESELNDEDVEVRASTCIVRSGNQLIGLSPWLSIDTAKVPQR
jgi:outer membrane protein assembly factor BamB